MAGAGKAFTKSVFFGPSPPHLDALPGGGQAAEKPPFETKSTHLSENTTFHSTCFFSVMGLLC